MKNTGLAKVCCGAWKMRVSDGGDCGGVTRQTRRQRGKGSGGKLRKGSRVPGVRRQCTYTTTTQRMHRPVGSRKARLVSADEQKTTAGVRRDGAKIFCINNVLSPEKASLHYGG